MASAYAPENTGGMDTKPATPQRPQLVTSLWFNGQAEEAARFYVDAFAGYRPDSRVEAVHRTDIDIAPDGNEVVLHRGEVLTVDFTLDGQRFTALNGGGDVPYTDAVSVEVRCANQQEVDHFADALSAGGGQEVACGWVTDRYGMRWQVVPEVVYEVMAGDDREASACLQSALMGMNRLSIEVLMDAAKDAHGAEEE